MDGNGRWARRRGLPVAAGHRAGTKALRRTVEAAIDLGVETLVVYAFSTENWSRPPGEVDALMDIFGETIERELPDLARQGVRTRFIGRRDRAPAQLQEQMVGLEEETAQNDRLNLWIAFDYGGRAELVEAARRLIEAGVEPSEIDENVFRANLYAPELPDPDLLIRTSGELRISNFLLWQLAYSELVFLDRALAGFRAPRARARTGRLRAQTPPLRRTMIVRFPLTLVGETVFPPRTPLLLSGRPRLRRGPPPEEPPGSPRALSTSSAERRPMSPFWSRILVAVVGLPVVLSWSGSGLVVVRACGRSGDARAPRVLLHRATAAPARPRGLHRGGARPAGRLARRTGLDGGGIHHDALRSRSCSRASPHTRQSITVAVGTTVLGAAWVGLGLAHVILLRAISPTDDGRLAVFTVLLAVFASDTVAYFAGALVGRHRLAPDDLAREDLGGPDRWARSSRSSCRSSRSTAPTSWMSGARSSSAP